MTRNMIRKSHVSFMSEQVLDYTKLIVEEGYVAQKVVAILSVVSS